MPTPRSGLAHPIATSVRGWNSTLGCGLRRGEDCSATFSRCWQLNENCRRRTNPTRAARREVCRRSSFQIPRGPSPERSRQHHRRLRLPQEFGKQHGKMVKGVFTFHGVAPAVRGGRAQTTLNIFAEADGFLLDFVAEGHRALDALLIFFRGGIVEKPFENSERLFMRQRNDHVGGNIVGINVEHQVWENPEVESLLQSRDRSVKALGSVFGFHGADACELLGVVAESVRALLRIIHFLHQTRMRDGDVVALEIVVNVDLPVAMYDVVAALREMQAFELESTRLQLNFTEVRCKRLGL